MKIDLDDLPKDSIEKAATLRDLNLGKFFFFWSFLFRFLILYPIFHFSKFGLSPSEIKDFSSERTKKTDESRSRAVRHGKAIANIFSFNFLSSPPFALSTIKYSLYVSFVSHHSCHHRPSKYMLLHRRRKYQNSLFFVCDKDVNDKRSNSYVGYA